MASLDYFAGSVPVRLFDEARGLFLDEVRTPSVDWNQATAPLLMEAFGPENFGIL